MKSRLMTSLVACSSLALALGSCDSSTGPVAPGGTVLELDPYAGTHLLGNAATIDSVWTDLDTLRLAVTYGGGCEEHDFRLVGAPGFSGEHPYELPLYLVHDGHGDNCRALVSETVSFDVSPASRLFRGAFDRDDLVAFRVHTRGMSGAVETAEALFFTGLTAHPRENVEADQMAIFLSGELTAPEELYARLRDDLARVREEYGDEVTANTDRVSHVGDVEFQLPWVPSKVLVAFEAAWADSVREGNYPYWDALNAALGAVSISSLGSFDYVVIRFEPLLNPCVLGSFYRDLPGVRNSYPDQYCCDWPGIYPRPADSKTTLLIRDAWGDCPAGCTGQEYWYFEVDDSADVVLRGKGSSLGSDDWGSEAMANLNLYDHLRQCPGE